MYITFPADEKLKPLLDAICQSLGITYDQWFETAIKSSEFDVLVKYLDNPASQKSWIWDQDLSQFVRRFEVE